MGRRIGRKHKGNLAAFVNGLRRASVEQAKYQYSDLFWRFYWTNILEMPPWLKSRPQMAYS
jgi:nitrate reductase assembly molybdenum cofactor insertion protein NarJ